MVASLAALSTASCCGKFMWPGIQARVMEQLEDCRDMIVRRIRWTSGFVEYGSWRALREERESVRRREFWGGMRLRWEMQERMALSSAEKMEAEFLIRADWILPLIE